ncbi:MAG: hypothetical protein R3D98_04740 [Candidatus Krumholzibacteriia bacterium]
MRTSLTILLMLALAGACAAFDLGNQRPDKPQVAYPQNVPDADRQGGDTILDAVPIGIPGASTGTTAGYTDDYDEVCPYDSMSPDVVYSISPAADVFVVIDMLGSTYDTKIYIYDETMQLIACNDDYYPDYVSKLEDVALTGGVLYYLVIDGYGGGFGDYAVTITEYVPCVLDCPAGASLEGEPPLADGYLDAHNGGCNSPEFGNPFGTIVDWWFCGVSGWYISPDGSQSRDTDWYELIVPVTGTIEIWGDAEFETYLFELGPHDCGSVSVLQNVIIGSCSENGMVISGPPGSTVWFWVGPTTFDGTGEYDYVLQFFWPDLPTEAHSWSSVKGLFD